MSTLNQEVVLSPSASTTQLWGLCHLEPCSATTVLGYLLYFQLILWKLSLWWSVPPGLTPLSPGSNARYSGIHCLMFSHPFPPHSSLVSLFGSDLSFREEGVKCDNTALTSQENSKEEEFIHDKDNAKTSVCDHRLIVSTAHYRVPLCLLHTCKPHPPPYPQLCKGICFIPTRVGNFASFIIV